MYYAEMGKRWSYRVFESSLATYSASLLSTMEDAKASPSMAPVAPIHGMPIAFGI